MTQNLEVKKQTPLEALRNTFESEKMRQQIQMALPKNISVDKFIRVVITSVSNNQELLSANRLSFYNACMKAAADGLVPDEKEAALVIMNKNVGTKENPKYEKYVQYMAMVSGVLKKVRNSGELKSIGAYIIYKNDKFEMWVDSSGEHFKHEPKLFQDKGEPIGVYAIAQTKDGGVYFEIMDSKEVSAIRQVAKTKIIWDGPFGLEKWKVACIRRLSKRLPMSTDLEDFQKDFDDDIEIEKNIKDEKVEDKNIETKKENVSNKLSELINNQNSKTNEPNESPLNEEEEQNLPI